jgi:hypothetical protein
MICRITPAVVAALLAAACTSPLSAAQVAADLLPPARRQAVVDTATRLTERPAPAPIPAEFPNPFNPVDPEQPAPPASRAGGPVAGPAAPVKPAGDREILETLAQRLTPSGSMILPGGKPVLIIGRDRFEPGTRFIVSYNEKDYELELVAIDRTTFTLRHRGEEITRPIKPVK